MHHEARERGCPDPVYEATSFFAAFFYPNPAVRDKVTGEVTQEVTDQVADQVPGQDTGHVAPEVVKMLMEMTGEMTQTDNAGLTMLYWEIGRRIRQDILEEKRAA